MLVYPAIDFKLLWKSTMARIGTQYPSRMSGSNYVRVIKLYCVYNTYRKVLHGVLDKIVLSQFVTGYSIQFHDEIVRISVRFSHNYLIVIIIQLLYYELLRLFPELRKFAMQTCQERK